MPLTVLIADDHAMFRDGLTILLRAQPGFEVVAAAEDGLRAVELTRVHSPDVVVLDIAMPHLNGIEAAARIREAGLPPRIIMLSMYSSPEHIYRALEVGALGYVLKEDSSAELIAAIHAVRAGARYLSSKISENAFDTYALRRMLVAERSPVESLSVREREILQLVCEGWSSSEIGSRLSLSPKTIETYRSRMMRKLQVDNLPDLVKLAVQCRLTPP